MSNFELQDKAVKAATRFIERKGLELLETGWTSPRGNPDRPDRQRRRHPGLHRRHRNRVRRGRLRGWQGHVSARASGGLLRHCARSRRPWALAESQGAACAQSRDGDQAVDREARAARKRRDQRQRIRGLESISVAAPRISQLMNPNQDGRLSVEHRALPGSADFLLPVSFQRALGINAAVAYTASHSGIPRHFPWLLPFSLKLRDSLLPIYHLGKRCAETAKRPIEFDLSFTDSETAPFCPLGQKPRVCSLGVNSYSHSSEYRPVLCRLETRGVNGEIAGERE